MNAKAHDTTRALVHHDENPVCPQDGGFASKQVETPQAVLLVTEGDEPRRPRRVWFRLVPNGENAPHHILVDGNTEGPGDLLSDPWTPPGRIPLFQTSTDSATTERAPPGPASRASVASRCRKRTARSRMAQS